MCLTAFTIRNALLGAVGERLSIRFLKFLIKDHLKVGIFFVDYFSLMDIKFKLLKFDIKLKMKFKKSFKLKNINYFFPHIHFNKRARLVLDSIETFLFFMVA